MLYSILESRNILNLVSANLWRLRSSGFIQHQINFLLVDDDRPNVANLVPIRIIQVKETVQTFNSAISHILEAVRSTDSNEELLRNILDDLAVNYASILKTIGFQSTINTEIKRGCRTTAYVLDLAVLSYVSAHIEDFDFQILGNTRESFRIPEDLDPDSPHITLHRCPTSCLDEFLKGGRIWAFREASLRVVNPQPPLYVSTNIDEFADFWGPAWRVHCDESPDSKIQRYDVLGGCIVPWLIEKSLHPKLVGDERLCHWSSRRPSLQSADEPRDQSLLSAEFTFTGQEKLLIDARQRRHHMEWSRCYCDIQDLEDRLRGLNRLQQLRTNRPYTYVDSRAVSLVGCSNGLTLGGNATIQRMKGVSFKDVFFDRWEKEPEARHPRDLTHLRRVAVSMCTMNAERVSVFELLTTPSVGRLLERFQWSNSDRKDQYITAVEAGDPDTLCNLWEKQREWQEELGKVLLVCLQALYHTGFDGDRDEFAALWVSPGSNLPKRVLLKPSEHSWIKFLCDSEVSFTVAVLHEECLGAKFGRRRCGWSEGKSALQTSISINNEIDPRKQLLVRNAPPRASSKWEWISDVSQLSRGTRFLVGAQGRLKTIEAIKGNRLLLEWVLCRWGWEALHT